MKQAYIYSITNIFNNKKYIGLTRQKVQNRWSNHKYNLRNNKHCNKKLQYSWNKYKESSFVFEIVEFFSDISDEDLRDKEIFYIDFFNSIKNGYNIDDGRKPISLEGRENMSKSHIGSSNYEKRKLKKSDVFRSLCALEYFDNMQRPLSRFYNLNKIVFKSLSNKTTYLDYIKEYENLSQKQKMNILFHIINYYKKNDFNLFMVKGQKYYLHPMKKLNDYCAIYIYFYHQVTNLGGKKIGEIFNISKDIATSCYSNNNKVRSKVKFFIKNNLSKELENQLVEYVKYTMTFNTVPSWETISEGVETILNRLKIS